MAAYVLQAGEINTILFSVRKLFRQIFEEKKIYQKLISLDERITGLFDTAIVFSYELNFISSIIIVVPFINAKKD